MCKYTYFIFCSAKIGEKIINLTYNLFPDTPEKAGRRCEENIYLVWYHNRKAPFYLPKRPNA